jgi:glutaredoxin 3
MSHTICNECETVAHCTNHGCIPKQPARLDIFIYTKSACPNCVTAKQLLKANNLRYVECDMDDPEVAFAFTFAHPDIRQMPQVFINDQRVGGLAGLQAALKQIKEAKQPQ